MRRGKKGVAERQVRLRCSPKCTSLVNLAREKHQFSLLARSLRLPAKRGNSTEKGARLLGLGFAVGDRGLVGGLRFAVACLPL